MDFKEILDNFEMSPVLISGNSYRRRQAYAYLRRWQQLDLKVSNFISREYQT